MIPSHALEGQEKAPRTHPHPLQATTPAPLPLRCVLGGFYMPSRRNLSPSPARTRTPARAGRGVFAPWDASWGMPLARGTLTGYGEPMSMNESFLASSLAQGKIRPTPGHLWCEKLATVTSMDVDGVGAVSVSGTTASGLVLVSDRTEEADTVLGNLLVVRALGPDPLPPRGWHTYCLGRERSWPLGTWEGQRIQVGTVIAIRAVAGVNQGRDRRYVQVRYDEIAAIGAPLDEPDDAPAMYPGPGWVLIHLPPRTGDDTSEGGVYVGEGRKDVFESGGVHWGTVYSLPRGFSDPSVRVGSRVAVPRWQSTEYLELEGDIRAVPWGDVLAVEE